MGTIGNGADAGRQSTVRFMVEDGLSLAKEHDPPHKKRRCPLRTRDSPPIAPEYRAVATLRLRPGVSLRVFIEREGEGS